MVKINNKLANKMKRQHKKVYNRIDDRKNSYIKELRDYDVGN